jgi:hypothetical protein
MTIKTLITTNAITFPSSHVLSMWTCIERALLSEEASKTMGLDCRRSKSVPDRRSFGRHGIGFKKRSVG